MKVSIYGIGYVGLVTGVCFAKLGHNVRCYDIDAEKIKMLQAGQSPIYEENLDQLLVETLADHSIVFSNDFNEVANHGLIHIIAVGTPSRLDGSADLSHVHDVATKLSTVLKGPCVVVNKSTVPVGTADRVYVLLGKQFEVVSNPEFLKEGKAVHDFMRPDRIIIGSNNERAIELMRTLYAPLLDRGVPFVVMSPRSSELTKYASNAFLATKISFINEICQLAERLGADINEVKLGMGHDTRINEQFLNPGCGYGGSCFPKDVSALLALAKQLDYPLPILKATQQTNERQKTVLFYKILHYFNGNLAGRRIALWGLAFKPGTDDVRSAPSLRLMELLWEAGAEVQAFDPMAMKNVQEAFEVHPQLRLCRSPEAALQAADVLAVVTEWPMFLNPDFTAVKAALKYPVIFDGRNVYDSKVLADYGIEYYAMGRGLSLLCTGQKF